MRYPLVALVVVLVVFVLGRVEAGERGQKIKNLLKKFEEFGRDSSKKSTGLTYDELDAAYEDYKDQRRHRGGDEYFEAARRKSPVFCLLDDFVLTPMKHMRLSPTEDDNIKRAYMMRAEKFFRLFWTSYVDGQLIGKKYLYKAKNFLAFLKAFEGADGKRPTVRMWRLAHAEYNALEQRAREMVTSEDIYDKVTEYGMLLNLFNDARVSILRDRFFARLDRCRSNGQLLELQAEYRNLKFY